MAGTIPLALSQQVDINGKPLAGCLLYFFQAGTVATLQDSFQDYGLTLPNPNPLPADQYGRIPMLYLADGQIHVRLTDASGVVIFDYPSMQVIGPSSGGGGGSGGGSVDPTTIASTGDVKFRSTAETLTGWVKLNGTTIGSSSSGASQRANADTSNLFGYLWSNFPNSKCAVSGGRGASSVADFAANKNISLPDWRSRAPVGLDDMGASAAGRILAGNVTSGGGDGPSTPAAYGGETNHTLTVAEAPRSIVSYNDPGTHTHQVGVSNSSQFVALKDTHVPVPDNYPGGLYNVTTSPAGGGGSINDNAGGGAHNNMHRSF